MTGESIAAVAGQLEQSAGLKTASDLESLPTVMLRIHTQMTEVLSAIRLTREALQAYSAGKLRDTHARLDEVNCTTESAAMEMLNGLDRTLAMIDQLQAAPADDAARVGVHHALRAEVNNLYATLQFQDIIAQKLRGVAALLAEVEQRMQTAAAMFDQSAAEKAAQPAGSGPTFNPDATVRNVIERQAMVDHTFGSARRITRS
jgi:chemotaxis regulatin CheY-phosphate phosphatase CheZ